MTKITLDARKHSPARGLLYELIRVVRDHTRARDVRIGDDWQSVRLCWYGAEYEVTIRALPR